MSLEVDLLEAFQAVEDQFNAAMVSNDPDLIALCVTDDGWRCAITHLTPVTNGNS